MLQLQLAEQVAKRMNLSVRDANDVINIVKEEVAAGLRKDGILKLRKFGSFQVKQYKARKTVMPWSGHQEVHIPAKKRVNFHQASGLKL